MRILALLMIICIASCTTQKEMEYIPNSLPEWSKEAVIYEVNIRQYTPEGTINAFAEHLPRIKEMGIKILWLMPIFPISDSRKKGSLGSYYAVSDFTKVNPEFGTMEDMDRLIQKIHELDMKIILDWVPNHTGWDHVWIKSNPSWYTQDENGNITDPLKEDGESHGWTDVADLNYESQEMRQEMLRQLKWWVDEKKVDGFRMDVSFLVPADFWQEVGKTFYDNKDLFFLAESENEDHRNDLLFHANYGWNLFHVMNDIAKGEKKAIEFIKTHRSNKNKFQKGNTMHFTSNHDENSWNGSTIERLGESHMGWAATTIMLDGIPLVYSGQEEPLEKRLAFFEKDTIPFENFRNQDLYTQLINIKKAHPALHNMPFGSSVEWLETSPNLLGYTRRNEDQQISFFFNPSMESHTLNHPLLQGTDLLSGEFHNDVQVDLKPYEFKIIKK